MVEGAVKGLCPAQQLCQVSTLRALHWAQRRCGGRRLRLGIPVPARQAGLAGWARAIGSGTLHSLAAECGGGPAGCSARGSGRSWPAHRSSFVPRSAAAPLLPRPPRPPRPAAAPPPRPPLPLPRLCRCVSRHLLRAASFSEKSMGYSSQLLGAAGAGGSGGGGGGGGGGWRPSEAAHDAAAPRVSGADGDDGKVLEGSRRVLVQPAGSQFE